MGFETILNKIRSQLDLLERDHDKSIAFLISQVEHQRAIMEEMYGQKLNNMSNDSSEATPTEQTSPQGDVQASFLSKEHWISDLPKHTENSTNEVVADRTSRTSNCKSSSDSSVWFKRSDSAVGISLNAADSVSRKMSKKTYRRKPSSRNLENDPFRRQDPEGQADETTLLDFEGSSNASTALDRYSSDRGIGQGAEVLKRQISLTDGLGSVKEHLFEIKEDWAKVPAASDIFLDQVDAMLVEKAATHMASQGGANMGHRQTRTVRIRQLFPQKVIMHPSSPVRLAWDLSGVALIGWDMVAIPIQLSFEPDPMWLTDLMGWLTLAFWTLDMIASVMTGFYKNGFLEMEQTEIIKNYLKGWFLVDLIVVVPDWVMKTIFTSNVSAMGLGRILRSARIFRVLRLLRLLKLKRLLDSIYDLMDSEMSFILFNLGKLLVLIIFMNHLVACAWYFVGRMTKEHGSPRNWLQHSGMTPVFDGSLAWKYLTSLHWSITQFTPASMDIWATNVGERLFSVVILFWALVMLSSIIGSITASMTALRNISADENKQFWILRRYLKQQVIPRDLTDRIIKYIEHQHVAKHNIVPASSVRFMSELSEQLHIEMRHAMFSSWLMDHPFFSYMSDDETMKSSMQRLCYESVKFTPCASEEILFNLGDEGRTMFFVKAGEYSYKLADGSSSTTRIGSRQWAAEAVLWTSWRHRGTLTAAVPSEALAIVPEKFSAVLHLHPKPWYFAMNYAVDFVNFMNRAEQSHLSDVMFDVQVWNMVVQDSDTYVLSRHKSGTVIDISRQVSADGSEFMVVSGGAQVSEPDGSETMSRHPSPGGQAPNRCAL